MIDLGNTTACLHLLQQHCQENKLFRDKLIAERHALANRHWQEKRKLPPMRTNAAAWAIVVQRQLSEIMEFKVIYQEEQWRLYNRQKEEKFKLTEMLSI